MELAAKIAAKNLFAVWTGKAEIYGMQDRRIIRPPMIWVNFSLHSAASKTLRMESKLFRRLGPFF
jgi:hypothetical protein